MASGKLSGLAKQISELSNPKPASFNPDEEDEASAKVCDFNYEPGNENTRLPTTRRVMLARARRGLDLDDPKYSGKVVNRRELEDEMFDSESDLSSNDNDLEQEELRAVLDHCLNDGDGSLSDDVTASGMVDDEESASESGNMEDHDGVEDGEEGSEEDELGEMDSADEEELVGETGSEKRVEEAPMALFASNNDVEKGKAAKEQIRLLDKLLELRIKFQRILALSNRLPSPETMSFFLENGGPVLKESLNRAHRNTQKLLLTLLGLQKHFLDQVDSTDNGPINSHHLGRDSGGSTDDEEIPSDEEEREEDESEEEERTEQSSSLSAKSRKRKRSPSMSDRDWESEVKGLRDRLRPYQDTVISKWNEKTRLASGKITSKAYIEVDRSILSQIQHILSDQDRLIKRTQLRRCVYHILGEKQGDEGEETSDPSQQRDAHLRDYNEDIFDDDDFYHQLLKELIERKTSYSESADPIEMGRQWLELQKMRTKAKKNVDTKASKGRKLRYNVHPKLVDFMAPVDLSTFSDTSRNDLFSSLFGAKYLLKRTAHPLLFSGSS